MTYNVTNLFGSVIKSMFNLFIKMNETFETPDAVNKAVPVIILLVQEMALQGIRHNEKREITQADAEQVANSTRDLQANPMAFGLMYISVQVGYLYAKHPNELQRIIEQNEAALKERDKHNVKL